MTLRTGTVTKQDWEQHKANIIELYSQRGLPLTRKEGFKEKEECVDSIMRNQHGFTASQWQYENQLKKWGIAKNLKQDEWISLLVQYKRLEDQGKEVRIIISGNVQTKEKIRKAMNRYCKDPIRASNTNAQGVAATSENDDCGLDFGELIDTSLFDTRLNSMGYRFGSEPPLFQMDTGYEMTFNSESGFINSAINTPTPSSGSSVSIDPAKRRQEIIDWLAPADWIDDFLRVQKKHSVESGRWFTKHDFFEELTSFKACKSSIGWVHGNAGVGKTVAVITQLICSADSIPSSLDAAFNQARQYGRTRFAWADKPVDLLKVLLSCPCRTFLVLDALDECKDIEDFLPDLVNIVESGDSCRSLMFSRDIPPVRRVLENATMLKVTPILTKDDVDRYLATVIPELPIDNRETRLEVQRLLSSQADGMFLWVHLKVAELKLATSSFDVLRVLNEPPEALGSVYQRALRTIAEKHPAWLSLTMSTISRVLCSPRPLSWLELQRSMAVGLRDEATFPFKPAVLKICSPFIEHHLETDAFSVAHLSVHQCLSTTQRNPGDGKFIVYLPEAHASMAKSCLGLMMELDDAKGLQQSSGEQAFESYATSYWCYHLLRSDADQELQSMAVEFLSSNTRRHAWLTRWLLTGKEEYPLQRMLKLIREMRHRLQASQSGTVSFDEMHDVLDVLVNLDIACMHKGKCGETISQTRIGHFERLMVIRELAREYTIAGRIGEGISHMEQCICRIQDMPSAAPGDWAWLASGLGIMYDQDGRRELALEKCLEALEIYQTSGKQDPFEIALSRNDIGRLYRHLGQWHESEKMHLAALELLCGIFPDTDFQIAWTRNTLARCYRKQGRLDEAIELHRKALEAQKAVIGLEHPHVLWAMSDVAKCFGDKGDFVRACEMQKESVRLREKVLGPLHHDYLWALNDLGILLGKAGKHAEAMEAHNIALAGQRRILKADHKTVAWTSNAIEFLKQK
ncbi:hypothetical protein PG991_011848 [Apiospora marii]|uniref:Clr5 domain-containing protein n=1 Tax=Apiospora marii TaxID=335849 RepID=A0ABR1RF88_9PEZI